MAVLTDPRAWVSFLTLALLEVVLGIDNIIVLNVLVERLAPAARGRGRVLGLGFAMLTRIGLLLSITWMASMRRPIAALAGIEITGRGLILFGGGVFVIVNSLIEMREMLSSPAEGLKPGPRSGFWLLMVQIGLIDIVFSLDTVFTAVGLSKQIEVMVAAIVAAAFAMMAVASAVGAFIDRYPTVKMLALAFLVLVGAALIAEAFDREVPMSYLYFAMGFSAIVEWLNIRLRRRRMERP